MRFGEQTSTHYKCTKPGYRKQGPFEAVTSIRAVVAYPWSTSVDCWTA